jgi:predicted glutamine amidotransferase
MINLTLLLLLAHYAAYLIFKPKSNVLGCGIFAWAGKKHTSFNRSKFDILGIINETRGVDSCGYTVDGEIYTGTGGKKVYRDFIAQTQKLEPKEIPVVIGHTRWSTVGAHTPENAHPFGFGTTEDGEKYNFIGVHNGTLLNHVDLAKQFKVSSTATKADKSVRTKIDSEILLEIIYTSQNFKVLNEYNGAAALVFYNILEPNVLYCYHGMSKKYSTNKEAEEERPLFYYQESKNSVYISSIEDSLRAIGGTDKNVFNFDYNTVYKIVDGDVSKAEKFRVSRLNRTQKSNLGSYGRSNNYSGYGSGWDNSLYDDYPEQQASLPLEGSKSGKGKSESANETKGTTVEGETAVKNIYQEPLVLSLNDYKNKVVFNKLRYWENGKPISGFYTFVDGWGFVKLGDTFSEADAAFWYRTNTFFIKGEFVEDTATISDDDWAVASMPFSHTDRNPIINPPIFPFYEGIRVKSRLDLEACVRMGNDGRGFDPVGLSMCSEHPVIDLSFKQRPDENQNIYLNGKKFTGNVAPLGSEMIYHIKNGNLTRLVKRKTPNDYVEVSSLSKVVDAIDKKQKKEENYVNDDLVDKEIDKAFMSIYTSFPTHRRILEKYLPNEKAEKAIEIINNFMKDTYKLVEIEQK